MVMPPSDTFSYFGLIHQRRLGSLLNRRFRCLLNSLDESEVRSDDPALTDRLLGLSPKLRISSGTFTLHAKASENARFGRASFTVNPSLTEILRDGDKLHICRTATHDLAVSAFRDNTLIYAIGAVTDIPTGQDVFVASGTISSPPAYGETFVKVSVDQTSTCLKARQGAEFQEYSIYVIHPVIPDVIPSASESVAIVRKDVCSLQSAVESARQLLTKGLSIKKPIKGNSGSFGHKV